MRKVYVTLTVSLILEMEEGIDMDEVIDEMDYDFTPTTENVTLLDECIEDYEVTDSK